MSASPHSFSKLPQGPPAPCGDVLGELLHSLSQPLTGLRCSLELSLEEIAEQQQESVAAALQEAEKIIGMIQLMREYLDAEQPGPEARPVALAPALRSVIGELSSIAAVRGIQLCLTGTSGAALPVPESRLRLALQYLIATVIEAQPAGGKVTLLLGEGPAGAVLRVEGERGFRKLEQNATSAPTLRRARLAIAGRVLESAGVSLVIGEGDGDPSGFVLRIPRRVGP